MGRLQELAAWVRFDDADQAHLRALTPAVRAHTDAIAERFYDRILESQEAAAVLRDEAQVARLRRTLGLWVLDLLDGPHDEAWALRQRRIGEVHVRVGLPHRYMFSAMTVLRDQICEIGHAASPATAFETARAVGRVADLSLALMTGTYLLEREAEQLATLRDLLVSHLPSTLLLVDRLGIVRTATRATAWLFDAEHAVGRRWTEVLPEALQQTAELHAHVAHACTTGHAVTLPRVEVSLDGRVRTLRIDVVPFAHVVADFLLQVEDLTPMVSAEGRAHRAEALARLGALSAAVAHELRNPLAGISGALQVLHASLDTGDGRREVMQSVVGQVKRLDALVSDLLTFARPRPADPRPLSLRPLLEEVGRLVSSAFPGLRVAVDGEGTVLADADQIHRVALNLATNAAQATEGRGTVVLHATPNGFHVEDDGPGVPEAVRSRIFEPFFTTKTQGTGLGLAICRQAVEACDGRLTLEALTGARRGANFRVALPPAP
jgi:signal transduction histidine kinase